MLDTWTKICHIGQKINTKDTLKEILLRLTTLGVEVEREESKIIIEVAPLQASTL